MSRHGRGRRTPTTAPAIVAAIVAALLPVLAACTPSDSDGPQATADSSSPDAAETSGAVGPDEVAGMPVWRQRSQIGTPRDDFAHVAIGDEIWAFGGMTGDRGTRLTTTEVYDTTDDTWRYGPDMPEGLASFEAAAIGPKAYMFGGLDENSEPSGFAAVLDTRDGTWQRLPDLPHPRYAHDVDQVDGHIYVLGGEDSDGPVAAVDVFDPGTGRWSQAAAMPDARSSIDIAPVGDRLFVLGGWLGAAPTGEMQVYDTGTDKWSRATPIPEPMSRGGATSLDGHIYASYHEWSYVYDVESDTWARANPMTVPRHGLGYIAVDGRIYGIGGCTEHPLRDVPFVDVVDVGHA